MKNHVNDWVLGTFVSSFSFNQLALTYFYLNVELTINDFLDRNKLISSFCRLKPPSLNSIFLMSFSLRKYLYLVYLGVSSPLRRLTSNDTPQGSVSSSLGAGVCRLLGPFLDISHPHIPWPSTRSFAFYFPL